VLLADVHFIAEPTSHIPDLHEKTALYYGWYSNRSAELATKPHPGLAEGPGAP
jgi:hypothetical protein